MILALSAFFILQPAKHSQRVTSRALLNRRRKEPLQLIQNLFEFLEVSGRIFELAIATMGFKFLGHPVWRHRLEKADDRFHAVRKTLEFREGCHYASSHYALDDSESETAE